LKVLFERANQEAKRQMDDNALLVRRLRKSEGGVKDGRDDEIRSLKTQLRSALRLIQKLQNEISEFKTRQQADLAAHSECVERHVYRSSLYAAEVVHEHKKKSGIPPAPPRSPLRQGLRHGHCFLPRLIQKVLEKRFSMNPH
jgi:hypothetical protein